MLFFCVFITLHRFSSFCLYLCFSLFLFYISLCQGKQRKKERNKEIKGKGNSSPPFCQSLQIFSFCSSCNQFSLLGHSLSMANWRKQQGQGQSQTRGRHHWPSSSYNRKPPLADNWHSTVPSWEKKFCASIGLVSWGKLIESKKYMYLHDNVLKWNDSAVKEAFDNAKRRFWAEINGLPCNIALPDPNSYIDDVDWDSSVDPELILDLESDAKVPIEEGRNEEVVILNSSLLLNQQPFSSTGWGDEDDAEVPKPSDPNSTAQGWDSNMHDNRVDSWEQHYAPIEHSKEYEWQNSQNGSWRWNQREHYGGGDFHKMGKGRSGWSGNWGAYDGYNRRRENMSWSKTPPAYNGNEYQMNRGRRNYRGGRRGNFVYDRLYVDKVPTPSAR